MKLSNHQLLALRACQRLGEKATYNRIKRTVNEQLAKPESVSTIAHHVFDLVKCGLLARSANQVNGRRFCLFTLTDTGHAKLQEIENALEVAHRSSNRMTHRDASVSHVFGNLMKNGASLDHTLGAKDHIPPEA